VHAGDFCPVHTAGCVAGTRWHTVCRKLHVQAAADASARGLLLAVGAALSAPADAALVAASRLAHRRAVAADAEAGPLARGLAASATLLACTLRNVALLPAAEAGTLSPATRRFSPAAAVGDVVRACRLAACARAPQVAWADADAAALPRAALGDRALFGQAVLNLMHNAVRFSADNGSGVDVSVACEPLPTGVMLAVTVADHGRGFSAAAAAHAFEPFQAAACAAGGGVGLGLFISRAIARAAGGDLTLDSAPGAGAALTLCMPVAMPPVRARDSSTTTVAVPPAPAPAAVSAIAAPVAQPRACAAAIPAPPLPELPMARRLEGAPATGDDAGEHDGEAPRLRCHVSDDHALNLMLVSRLLERTAGFEVECSADGREAYDSIVAAAERGRMPHLIILDMQMPRWSGPDAARAVRAWEAAQRPPRQPVPMYALTANVLEEHRAECDAAGMDGFLTKPPRAAALPELQRRAREYQRSVYRRSDYRAKLRDDLGEAFQPLVCDVRDAVSVKAAALSVSLELHGRCLAALVCNPGVAPMAPLLLQPVEEVQAVLDVNVVGVLRCCQAFAPLLGTELWRAGRPGCVVVISSVDFGSYAAPFWGAYCSSKWAAPVQQHSV